MKQTPRIVIGMGDIGIGISVWYWFLKLISVKNQKESVSYRYKNWILSSEFKYVQIRVEPIPIYQFWNTWTSVKLCHIFKLRNCALACILDHPVYNDIKDFSKFIFLGLNWYKFNQFFSFRYNEHIWKQITNRFKFLPGKCVFYVMFANIIQYVPVSFLL